MNLPGLTVKTRLKAYIKLLDEMIDHEEEIMAEEKENTPLQVRIRYQQYKEIRTALRFSVLKEK